MAVLGCCGAGVADASARGGGAGSSKLRAGFAAGLALAALGCAEPARRLGAGPGGNDGARRLVEALALRFGPVEREPAFDALRPKLARAALVPSWVWDDPGAWPRQGPNWRAVDFAGYQTERGYALGVRPTAPEPATPGQYRGQLRLERLASGRFEWAVREELAVGPLRPAELSAALDALFRAAEVTVEARARPAIEAAFPRSSRALGRLVRLETLALARDAGGAASLTLGLRLVPDGLRAEAPHFAEFVARYFLSMHTRARLTDETGATWWTLESEAGLWTARLRVRGGSLVPLEGDAARRLPARVRLLADYATRMGRFQVAASGLAADVELTRTPVEKGFVARFRQAPDWDLPFLAETFLGAPLHYPFEGPGSEAGWAARETGAGTLLVRHYRARVGENFVLRWLGGMTNRAVSDFRAGAEDEAERFYRGCLVAIRDDLVELLRETRAAG